MANKGRRGGSSGSSYERIDALSADTGTANCGDYPKVIQEEKFSIKYVSGDSTWPCNSVAPNLKSVAHGPLEIGDIDFLTIGRLFPMALFPSLDVSTNQPGGLH